jgi:hypothetical protein
MNWCEHLVDFTRQIIAAGSAAVIIHARKAVLLAVVAA